MRLQSLKRMRMGRKARASQSARFRMTTRRLAILFAVLVAGLGSVFVLPQQIGFQPVGIVLELPTVVDGGWYGKDLAISDKERVVLGEGTEFSRKLYRTYKADG